MKKILIIVFSTTLFSCANIIAPSGGPKDIIPPKVINKTQNINLEGTSEFVYSFDERIVLNDFNKNFYVSPPVENASHKIKAKDLIIKIEDDISDTLIYSIKMDNCIKDITEGNILKDFTDNFTFNKEETIPVYSLKVNLEDAYSRKKQEDHWVLIYNSNVKDSLIFNSPPNYVARTNESGIAYFNNLLSGKYNIYSLSGIDYKYHDDEWIAFNNSQIISDEDTLVNLLSFNPLQEIDSFLNNPTDSLDDGGVLTVTTGIKDPYVIQLLKGDKVSFQKIIHDTSEVQFYNIPTGEYNLRLYFDRNENGLWDTGDFTQKIQAEKTYIYPEGITIRSNWDLELDWNINQ